MFFSNIKNHTSNWRGSNELTLINNDKRAKSYKIYSTNSRIEVVLLYISTKDWAFRELITDNFNGFNVPKSDYKELGEKII